MTHSTPFTQNFLESILTSIDSKDPVVANAWLDTLLDVVDLLPIEVLGKEVLEIAINKAGDSQPTFSRLGSCQLVGKLGVKLEQQVIQDELIPMTQNLSQDAEWTVRASMCAQLVSIVKGLTKNGESSEKQVPVRVVLSVLFELGDDEVEAVRLVVVETASAILQYLDEESIQTLVVPWFQRICNRASKDEDKTLPLLAQHWARISRTLQVHLKEAEKEWFVDYFFALASLGSAHQPAKDKINMPDVVAHTDTGKKLETYAEIRHACAVNSSAMIPFVGVEAFLKRFSSVRALAADPYFVVRRAVATNVLDLCRQLHPFSSAVLSLLNKLLMDPCADVTYALVPQIGAVIEHLARLSSSHQTPFVNESIAVETCETVLRCEEQVMNGSSWRIQADMLSQLAAFPLCLPCNSINDLLIPRLWHRIETVRPLPCRVQAAQTLMLCIRSERRRHERSALCSDIITRLASANSCHKRMLFLRASPILFDLLSRKFIRQHFFLPLVRLAGDKVANIRLRFATLLPKLHISLRGLDVESEKVLIVELDSAVRWLVESEKDRDVKNELASFFRWVEEQEAQSRTPEAEQRLRDEEEADKRKTAEEENVNQDPVVLENVTTIEEPNCSSFFLTEEPQPPAIQSSSATAEERPAVALDPSTDDFYRDAGVRLTTASAGKVAGGGKNNLESRIPSIQSSRLRPPGQQVKSASSTATLPHFGIARGVQQIQPQPSMAYGVSVAPPMRRDLAQRRSFNAALSASKSRSQENLNATPKPRAARPISTCLGSNDILAASKTQHQQQQSPFIRNNRQRASIGGPVPFSSAKHVTPPIATLPPVKSSESSVVSKWASTRITSTKASQMGSVKLSDMKNALPITPIPARKLTTTSSDVQFSRRRQPVETSKVSSPAPSAATQLDEAAAQMMESLELSTTRLRKPLATNKLAASSPVEMKVNNASILNQPPESAPIQRRHIFRRSLHFTTATSSPPPPPPRKNFATLPKTVQTTATIGVSGVGNNNAINNNNNNNHNNNNNNPSHQATPSSKLPVPAFKRNSHLGSNF